MRRVRHHAAGSRVATLDASGSVSVTVDTPGRRAAYLVRLAPTPLHTGARARVVVVPPAVASVVASASSHRVIVGGSLTTPAACWQRTAPGSPDAWSTCRSVGRRWFGVGSATTDASGAVAIATPAASRTVRYRLRVGTGPHSSPWRVAMVPSLSASTRPDGAGVDVVATAVGGHAGDRVVLLRRRNGRLVPVQHASLGADGTVAFLVSRRPRTTTYVVRLTATPRHTAATARTTVAGTR